ncbi:MAG TPA: prepilin-type N-terminal cleavage/methylation domain-containing protein [Gaiellaceae bacterium]|nr:prepilin-type N-terminal cleavage/methylation domain-containing protein [Gaiellaceae bacterium]
MRALAREESGFTLIELLTVLSILVVVVTAFTLVLQTTLTRGATITEHATLESEARPVLDTMAAELRQAACNGTIQPIVTASHTQLTFYTPDKQIPYHMREVSYALSGGALTEAQATSTNTSSTYTPATGWQGLTLGSPVQRVGSVTNSTVFQYEDLYWQVLNPATEAITSNPDDLIPSGQSSVSSANLDNIAYVTITLDLRPYNSISAEPVVVESTVSLRQDSC